jgi:predicted transcriptional regulator
VQREFDISQPAVSLHLRVLRENGFVTARAEGTRRYYTVDPAPLREVDLWMARYRHFWTPRLDALAAALASGQPEQAEPNAPAPQTTDREQEEPT